MKFIRFLGFLCLVIPCVLSVAVAGEFQDASKLLVAARRGDIQTVQVLINSGVDVNYVDSTGLSLVCTAVMNNDKRAIQVLQMYGADASDCDKQIKQYQQKTRVAKKGNEYGFFSGLSSTHVIVLSAVGVAAVVGGVVLLANVFDNDKGHHSSGTNGDRPNNNENGGGTSTEASKLFTQNLPVGPGACTGTNCSSEYPTWEGMLDFDYMSNNTISGNADVFNYLMASRAYDAFARGYLGMGTIRLANDLSPFNLASLPYVSVPGGGNPKNVAMITGNGVNATGSAIDGTITWVDADQISTVQSICAQNGSESEACQNALIAATKTSHKYHNLDNGTEDAAFDLSGSGTVFGLATTAESKLAKIIAGWQAGERATPDFYGFIPNGQLTVYKTGAGTSWVDPSAPASGTYNIAGETLAVGDTFNLFGGTLTVTSVNGNAFVATLGDDTYHGYLVGDKLFIDSNADGNTNQMYLFEGTNLNLSKELSTSPADYKNYTAIYNAVYNPLMNVLDMPNVIVNLSLPSAATGLGYSTVDDAKIGYAISNAHFLKLVDDYYNLNTADDTDTNVLMPSTAANLAFTNLGKYANQILVNPAGRSILTGGTLSPKDATFENFAPVAYNNLQNLFMTVVAVRPTDGTKDDGIGDYSAENAGTLELSTWADPNDSSTIYSSRVCGLTGNGNDGAMNPWCFSAPGATDLEATAAMAGSVALVKSAFDYMTPKEIFLLLALTADGPYLGTNPETNLRWEKTADLITYLRKNYTLPIDSPDAQYLEKFKTVFGYGMINLERATRPGTNIYFYSSDKNTIVSGNNKAYWGNGTSNSTNPRASSVLSLTGKGAIKTAFYDVLQSADGEISLPRIWNMNFVSDTDSKHGLYMGDVLADFAVGSANRRTNQIGNFTFDMALSPRAYNDNLNGLDNLRIAFNNEKYDIDAEYQRFLTDGESRFSGRANGVLSLVANSVASGAKYKIGNFAFGTRAFSGTITDENLLENDPAISSQFEPARLGFANGIAIDTGYKTDKFAFNVAVGNLHETNTVLGMYSDGILTMRGGDTQYIDAVVAYKPFERVKLTMRGTFADTRVDTIGGIISDVSDIKSNAFAIGADVGGFGFTMAMPLATVAGKMGYDYAEYSVVENDGNFEVAVNNPHVEYIDLAKQKRELRFSSSYKTPLGKWTDAGIGFIYRVNPNNTDAFGNESLFMFKLHHRLGI